MGRKENEEHPAGRDAVAEALEAACSGTVNLAT